MEQMVDRVKEFPEELEQFEEGEMARQGPRAMTIRDTQATSFLDPNVYLQLKALAQDFIKSGAIPAVWDTPAKVLVGLQTGAEMGMKPMEAMNSLYPVNGAINVWGKATARRLREHGWVIEYSDETPDAVTATIRRGEEAYTETFSFAEAEASGYVRDGYGKLKLGWREGVNRRKKLRYGVLSLLIATYVPEVLGSGVGVVEVSEDYDFGEAERPVQIEASVSDIAEAVKHASDNQ